MQLQPLLTDFSDALTTVNAYLKSGFHLQHKSFPGRLQPLPKYQQISK